MVIVLGHEEICQQFNFSHYRTGEMIGQSLNYSLSVFLLSLIDIEYNTAVLRTDVVALPIQLSRVMAGKEYLEQSGSPDDFGIEGHSNYLSVAGALATDLLISWIIDMPP